MSNDPIIFEIEKKSFPNLTNKSDLWTSCKSGLWQPTMLFLLVLGKILGL